jgi:ATP-binding cassette subfamily B protein
MSTGTKPAGPLAAFVREMRTVGQRWRQVWQMVSRDHRRALLAGILVMLVNAGATAVFPFWIGGLVDCVQGKQPLSRLSFIPMWATGLDDAYDWKQGRTGHDELAERLPGELLVRVVLTFLVFVAGAYLVRELSLVARKYLVEGTSTRIEKETAVKLVTHLLKGDLHVLSRERIGALHGRIHCSVEGFVKLLKLGFMDLFPALCVVGSSLVLALTQQPRVGLVMAGVIPVSLALTIWQMTSQKGIRLQLLRSKEALDGTVVEQLGGIEYIRAANTHTQEAERVAHAAETRRLKAIRHHMAMAWFGCFKALNEGLFHIIVIAYAIYLATIRPPVISLGDVLTFSTLFLSVIHPLKEVHRILDEAHESSLQVGDLLDMLHTPVDKSFFLPTLRYPELELGEPMIVTEGLTVEYRTPDGRTKRALDNVSLSIRHGETIGAAGRSGSGKSTWLKVVMRLVHPTSGRVILGGEPLEAASREVIAKLIGYVSQTPFVFAGTIQENIAYGNPGATLDDVVRAAEMACIHEEILAMPGGYQFHVSERGHNLSGGQRQRIALARAFLKNPPILILDEGTSALDNISERAVQRAIAAARADRTVIMVAHRLTTLRDSDRILVFDEGRIVEQGTYDELLQQGGVFAELVHSAGDVSSGV